MCRSGDTTGVLNNGIAGQASTLWSSFVPNLDDPLWIS